MTGAGFPAARRGSRRRLRAGPVAARRGAPAPHIRPALRLAVLTLVLTVSAAAAAPPVPRCAPFGAAAKARVTRTLRRQFGFAASFRLASALPVAGTCYVRLTFSDATLHRTYLFFLTPDRRYVTAALYSLTAAPDAAARQQLIAELGAAPSPARGPAGAAVTLVEFSDFECPFCRRLAEFERGLPNAERAQLRIVFKFFPLASIHPWAETAARAAACADFQSNAAFWRAHDFFFGHQLQLSSANAAARIRAVLAKAPGFSLPEYERCIELDMGAGVVARDQALGNRLGVTATPTFYVNGRRYVGIASEAALRGRHRPRAGSRG